MNFIKKLTFCAIFPLLFNFQLQAQREISVVFDAGSSGTTAYIFEANKDNFKVKKIGEGDRFEPGISKKCLEGNEKLEKYLSDIVLNLEEKISSNSKYEELSLNDIKVFFRTTAGVRLMSPKDQTKCINATRGILEKYSFSFLSVDILSGKEEGVYAWIDANEKKETIGKTYQQTYGMIEMGGASFQITYAFAPLKEKTDHLSDLERLLFTKVKLKKHNYHLLSYSFDGLGIGAARAKYFISPCKIGDSGNYEKCKENILNKVFLEKKELKGVQQVFMQTKLFNYKEIKKFIVRGVLANQPYNIGIDKDFTIRDIDAKGKKICALKSQNDFYKMFHISNKIKKYVKDICFDLAYFSVVLSRIGFYSRKGELGYQFTHSQRFVELANQLTGGWARGLVLLSSK